MDREYEQVARYCNEQRTITPSLICGPLVKIVLRITHQKLHNLISPPFVLDIVYIRRGRQVARIVSARRVQIMQYSCVVFYFAPPHAAVNRSVLNREKGTRCRNRLSFTVLVGGQIGQIELAGQSCVRSKTAAKVMTSGHGYGKVRSARRPKDVMSTIQAARFQRTGQPLAVQHPSVKEIIGRA